MTIREIWLELARQFEEENLETDNGRRNITVKVKGYVNECAFGLCDLLEDLLGDGKITEDQYAILKRAITKRDTMSCYIWPCTLEGAASRREFCRQQAEASE